MAIEISVHSESEVYKSEIEKIDVIDAGHHHITNQKNPLKEMLIYAINQVGKCEISIELGTPHKN
jgi:hypothetical protein